MGDLLRAHVQTVLIAESTRGPRGGWYWQPLLLSYRPSYGAPCLRGVIFKMSCFKHACVHTALVSSFSLFGVLFFPTCPTSLRFPLLMLFLFLALKFHPHACECRGFVFNSV